MKVNWECFCCMGNVKFEVKLKLNWLGFLG